ncbi:reticulon-2-like isoform X1 [Portunus trituberculatus]|uniref:reticulon-2-like isoform X1 n=1 Tax=Portunus trituberculatus TaxID=210409 RepID=UPI001E1CBD67|nr:reticulon-2-like isoform X1 [Portunus trituberculatus]
MADFDQFSTKAADPTPSQDSVSYGSNRDSLNLDDFEKVEADQVPSNVSESSKATANLLDDMSLFSGPGKDLSSLSTSQTSEKETKPGNSLFSADFSALPDDPFKKDNAKFDPSNSEMSPGSNFDSGVDSNTPDTLDLIASAPAPPSSDISNETSSSKSNLDDFLSSGDKNSPFSDFMTQESQSQKPTSDLLFERDLISDTQQAAPAFEDLLGSVPMTAAPPAAFDPVPEPVMKPEPTPPPREPTPPRREPTPPPREPTPPRQPTPPPREPTPPPRQPTPPPREPTPPPREPTPPPRQPTPPPRQPTPPPREPTPPPRQPTPPPREPTPPPRQPTPPPREPTPPPRQPTPPREPTPPPREPTPPPRQPTPPREATPPLLEPVVPVPPKVIPAPIQEARVTSGRTYQVSEATKASFAVFNPRAWFNPAQLDPRVVDLIYWRDVKKTGVVFGGVMVILLSLAYLSLISVVSYTSLAILSGTITFRVYKNIMQAVQKSQDGHPFKNFLEKDTNLPSDKVHEATDVIVKQINSTVTELKRLFLVEDLVDSVKFGCLLWCLTYLGSWFNGLTLVILAVVALFTLPKVYEQNQAQIDQYVGLVRTQVNDVMSKVKAALPIGNKEKSQ